MSSRRTVAARRRGLAGRGRRPAPAWCGRSSRAPVRGWRARPSPASTPASTEPHARTAHRAGERLRPGATRPRDRQGPGRALPATSPRSATAGAISVANAQPADGCRIEEDDNGPAEVRVEFESARRAQPDPGRGGLRRRRPGLRGRQPRQGLTVGRGARVSGCPSPTSPPLRPRGARGRGGRAGRRGAAGPGRDGRGGGRRDGRRPAPARPGRHRHRQVARLPRPQPAARQAGRRRHRHARPPAPARRARHPAAGRGGRRPGSTLSYAVLKGRSNYACLHRIREGVPDDQGTLVDVPVGSMGAEGARAAGVGRGGGQGAAAAASATARRATPTASGGRSASATATAWAPPSARSARSASSSWPARRPSAAT